MGIEKLTKKPTKKELEQRVRELESENAKLKGTIDGLAQSFRDLCRTPIPGVPYPVPSVPPIQPILPFKPYVPTWEPYWYDMNPKIICDASGTGVRIQ